MFHEPETVVLGLNPAWQRIFEIDGWQAGAVHRMRKVAEYASGKGVNCLKTLYRLGVEASIVQCLGGSIGERLACELQTHGVVMRNIKISEETRMCTTLLHDGYSTELIEPSPRLSESEIAELEHRLNEILTRVSRVVVCGTLPENLPASRMVRHIPARASLVLDTWKDLQSWMVHPIDLLKINRNEWNQVWNGDISQGSSEIFEWMRAARVRILVITDGPRPAVAYSNGHAWQLEPLSLSKVSNTVGSGDVFLAAWIDAEERGSSIPECLAWASACAASRCMASGKPWEFDLATARSFHLEMVRAIREII